MYPHSHSIYLFVSGSFFTFLRNAYRRCVVGFWRQLPFCILLWTHGMQFWLLYWNFLFKVRKSFFPGCLSKVFSYHFPSKGFIDCWNQAVMISLSIFDWNLLFIQTVRFLRSISNCPGPFIRCAASEKELFHQTVPNLPWKAT